MFTRKHTSQAMVSSPEREKHHHSHKTKDKPHHQPLKNPLSLLAFLSFSFLLLFLCSSLKKSQLQTTHNSGKIIPDDSSRTPTCDSSAWVYVYDLPPEFNLALLSDCRHLNVYTDMCPHVTNSGLGQPLSGMGPTSSWFATHQFIAEMIFHARVLRHPCRTRDPARANIFYVPFYGGLHASSKFREPDLAARDALAVQLAEFLQRQPPWRRKHGRDHFLALGRTAWDFLRTQSGPDFGANSLLNLPPVQNMSVLTVERNPWQGPNQHGMPYPSYFHPSTAEEMTTWQARVRLTERRYLFSFIGAPRKGVGKAAARDEIMQQCATSTRCRLVDCSRARAGQSKCYAPQEVVGVMMESVFCLQAPGDSFTRRSTFDAVLAGCIPVFFSRHTAYTQYEWFLPSDPSAYSVFIDGGGDGDGDGGGGRMEIEEELGRIPAERVEGMRRRVVEMIPGLTYAHPNATRQGFRDAVDIALTALSKHVHSVLH